MPKTKSPHPKPKKQNKLLPIFRSQFLSLCCYILFYLAASGIAFLLNLSPDKNFYSTMAAFAAASFLVALLSSKGAGEKGMLVGLTSTGICNVLCLLLSCVCNHFHVDLRAGLSLLILLLCAMLGGVCGVNTKQKAKMKPRKGYHK